jgi:hypothetical protein
MHGRVYTAPERNDISIVSRLHKLESYLYLCGVRSLAVDEYVLDVAG